MTTAANSNFREVCKQLNMTKTQEDQFHRYLANQYRVTKDTLSFQQLMKAGREFMDGAPGGFRRSNR